MNNQLFSFRRLALNEGSVELTEAYIRQRAYQIYEQRGREDGHDVEDWLEAEAQIFGKRPGTSDDKKAKESDLALSKEAA